MVLTVNFEASAFQFRRRSTVPLYVATFITNVCSWTCRYFNSIVHTSKTTNKTKCQRITYCTHKVQIPM